MNSNQSKKVKERALEGHSSFGLKKWIRYNPIQINK